MYETVQHHLIFNYYVRQILSLWFRRKRVYIRGLKTKRNKIYSRDIFNKWSAAQTNLSKISKGFFFDRINKKLCEV